jgi:heterodisulfide reductase subunit A
LAEIVEGPDNNPAVIYEDTRERKVKRQEFDMVILATACAPSKGIAALARTVGVELDPYNFLKTSPLSPVDTTTPRHLCVRLCRVAHGCAGIRGPGIQRCRTCR